MHTFLVPKYIYRRKEIRKQNQVRQCQKHKLYSAILQETKKTSADFIQVQLTSMISNTETISSVRKSPVSLGTCNKNLLIRKRSFMFPRTVDESEHDKEKAITTTVTMETKRIPIYIHFSTQRYIIYITNDSLRDIQKGILEKSRIPIDLQMIVYQGRILGHTSNVALQRMILFKFLLEEKVGCKMKRLGRQHQKENWMRKYKGRQEERNVKKTNKWKNMKQ
jgi:hypothetical protein